MVETKHRDSKAFRSRREGGCK